MYNIKNKINLGPGVVGAIFEHKTLSSYLKKIKIKKEKRKQNVCP